MASMNGGGDGPETYVPKTHAQRSLQAKHSVEVARPRC